MLTIMMTKDVNDDDDDDDDTDLNDNDDVLPFCAASTSTLFNLSTTTLFERSRLAT